MFITKTVPVHYLVVTRVGVNGSAYSRQVTMCGSDWSEGSENPRKVTCEKCLEKMKGNNE